ncbi:MAG: hypothetical protein KDI07_18080 [Anaerolineae bacterium]|nr:hypothetical protein [Anaerolineae bacterium]MCB0243835.1 hypothetical protein [Anaerolineae bacterium]MCB0250488.1 hypothetical protein [Anaerolineae bacterium]MCB9129650.1 hypothetical protein [Anaerolineales bacterium]MCO5245924.1 hypothetical protein [Anaerolineae bacterium]
MKRQRIASLASLRPTATVLGLLIAGVAVAACFAPSEVTSRPTAVVAVATDTDDSHADAATVVPVADADPVRAVMPTSVITANASTDFNILAGTWGSEDYFTPIIEIDATGAFTST